MRTAVSRFQTADFEQRPSFPRRVCARVMNFFPTPIEGWRSADRRTGAAAPVRPAHDAAGQALARRLASLSGGTRASRRSTLAIFGFGSALPSPAPAFAEASAGEGASPP